MEFDSGSSVSVCTEKMLQKADVHYQLQASNKQLQVANGQLQKVIGKAIIVDVTVDSRTVKELELFVVENHFPTLFGRAWIHRFWGENWLEKLIIGMNQSRQDGKVLHDTEGKPYEGEFPADTQLAGVRSVNVFGVASAVLGKKTANDGKFKTQEDKKLRTIEELKTSEVFNDELGLVKNYQARLQLKEDSRPVSQKTRSVPYAMKDKIETELETMVNTGILKKMESPWGTPVQPVRKAEGVRICGD